MDTLALPHCDLRLSRIGLGCWTLGREFWGDDHDDDRAVRTVHAALAAGVTWVDTAPLYGRGHADTVVRRALAGRPEVAVATKVGVQWRDTASGHAESLLTPAHIVADCTASLERLGRDRIDLLQVHWPDQHDTALEDSVAALEGLKAAGHIRAWGLCNYDATGLAQARALGRVSSLQTPYSLLRRELEGALGTEAQRVDASGTQVPVLAYETLVRGLLSGRFRTLPRFPDTDQRSWDERFAGRRFAHARALVTDLERVADKVGVTTAALAVGWVLSRPQVGGVIVGARRPEQIEQTVAAAALAPRRRLWSVVDRVASVHGGS